MPSAEMMSPRKWPSVVLRAKPPGGSATAPGPPGNPEASQTRCGGCHSCVASSEARPATPRANLELTLPDSRGGERAWCLCLGPWKTLYALIQSRLKDSSGSKGTVRCTPRGCRAAPLLCTICRPHFLHRLLRPLCISLLSPPPLDSSQPSAWGAAMLLGRTRLPGLILHSRPAFTRSLRLELKGGGQGQEHRPFPREAGATRAA